jgi:hypothetical protein
MEVARAWTEHEGLDLPPEVSALLQGHPHFGEILSWSGEPEAKLPFDSFPGEPRNTDIAVVAEDRHGKYMLAVEAKADEPFAATVAMELASTLERKLANPRSNGLLRIEQLATAILGVRARGDQRVGELRYQLLTATAGALCEAERSACKRAVLLIHEFVTSRTTDEKHAANAKDLLNFLSRLAHLSSRGRMLPATRGNTLPLVPHKIPGSSRCLNANQVPLFVMFRCQHQHHPQQQHGGSLNSHCQKVKKTRVAAGDRAFSPFPPKVFYTARSVG